MKRLLLLALVLGLTLGVAGVANAALITDVHNVGRILWGNGFVTWSHDVNPDFSVPPDIVNSASLTISGWFSNGSNSILIESNIDLGSEVVLGSLPKGIYSFAAFGLTQYFQAGWGPSNGTFDVTMMYYQPNYGMILNSSVLSIDYTNNGAPGPTPTPEPGTMLLLGSGLVGLAAWGRKKFRK